MASFLLVLALVVPIFAAPRQANNQLQQNGQASGPPKECEKPFGDGELATVPNPYNFTVVAKQRSDVVDYKTTFKGAPVDMIVTFSYPETAGKVKAFALRAGLPFPVVQWQGSNNYKIVSCIAPESLDTVIGEGSVGQRFALSAVPLLAAWGNQESIPVIYEMAIQGADGHIYVAAYNGTIRVKETDYKLPERFFKPPPELVQQMQQAQLQQQRNGGRGQNGQQNFQQDPRFQQFRQRRETSELTDQEEAEFDGN